MLQLRTLLVGSSMSLMAFASCGHHEAPLVDPALSPMLELQADAEAHAAIPDGLRLRDVLVGVAYDRDEGTSWTVPLEAGRCYAFGYAADTSAPRMSLYLSSPGNRRALTGRGRPGQGVMNYCAAENGMFRLEAKVAVGAGHFVVVTYVTGPGGSAPVVVMAASPGALPAVAMAPAAPPAPSVAPTAPVPGSIEEIIARQAASAAPGAARVGELYTGIGDRSDWTAQLAAGTCYWFIGVGDAPAVKSLELQLWDPKMARITENKSDNGPAMIGYCASWPGAYKFEAKVSRGHGTYKVGLYAK